jgi:hypothetical protein
MDRLQLDARSMFVVDVGCYQLGGFDDFGRFCSRQDISLRFLG